MTSLTVLFLVTFTLGTVAGFTQKSECLLHTSQAVEVETEGERSEDGGGDEGETEGVDREVNLGQRRHHSEEEREDINHRRQNQVGLGRQSGHRYLDEEGEWEDARKRRKRGDTGNEIRSLLRQDTLVGQLSCGADAMIHVLNVSVGYSSTGQCYQASVGCQAGSSVAKQVIHCQGNKGACVITIERHFLIRCGHQANFALVFYECVPDSKRATICSNTNSDISGAIVLTSSNYPEGIKPQHSPASTDIVTCECTLRAPANSHLEMEYIRTHLPMTGSTCDGDMLVLERPDPINDGRYILEREICGQNVSSHVVLGDKTVRVTFLMGSPLSEGKKGFLAKFKALSTEGFQEVFHVTCMDGRPGPSQDFVTKSTVSHSNLASRRVTTPQSTHGRAMPPKIDPAILPANFLNLTHEQLQAKLELMGAQAQRIVGAQKEGFDRSGASGSSRQDSSSSGGVLSGIVASLSSVVLILCSLGAFIFYKRHQKQKQHKAHAQTDVRPTGADYWHKVTMTTSKLEKRTKGGESVPSVKNQNRPLPNPRKSSHNSPRSDVTLECKTRGPLALKMVQNDQNGLDSKTKAVSGDGSKIYSIAACLPDSAAACDEIAKVSDMPRSSTEIRPQTLAPPHRLEKNCQSNYQPIAPRRTKRHKETNKLNAQESDCTSPYDNASININKLGNMDSVSEENADGKTSHMVHDMPPTYSGSVDNNHCFNINITENEDENYSSIHDIQLKVSSDDNHDNDDNTDV